MSYLAVLTVVYYRRITADGNMKIKKTMKTQKNKRTKKQRAYLRNIIIAVIFVDIRHRPCHDARKPSVLRAGNDHKKLNVGATNGGGGGERRYIKPAPTLRSPETQ